MNKRVVGGLGVLAVGLVGLGIWRFRGDAPSSQPRRTSNVRIVEPTVKDKLGKAGRVAKSGPPVAPSAGDPAPTLTPSLPGMVIVSGAVIDSATGTRVPGAEVVLLATVGGAESSTMSAADGSYSIEVPIGVYRAFARGDHVLSIGTAPRIRIPGQPSADDIGVPVADRMPVVAAVRNLGSVDLEVVQAGTVSGTVVDGEGKPIAGAVVRASNYGRSVSTTLGTDVAETDAKGAFELKLPGGGYVLEATHAKFAALAEPIGVRVSPLDDVTVTLALVQGCIIAGRVVLPSGAPAGEGAIEEQYAPSEAAFAPVGRIAADGTFRYTTVAEQEVVLRAWPWKAPPADAQRFSCKNGARFSNVVFRLPNRTPDLEGVLVDHDGKPVAFTHVDLMPLDPGGIGQQERTDEHGRWSVYALPAGRYQVSAAAPERGVVSEMIASPAKNVKLALKGTGRLEGTLAQVDNGTLEIEIARCLDGMDIEIARERRVVQVEHGHFSVDDLPACQVALLLRWRDGRMFVRTDIQAGSTATVDLDADASRDYDDPT